MARTSDRISVAFQSLPALENIRTSFEFKLTAISDPTRWSERTGLTTATITIETHGTYPRLRVWVVMGTLARG